MSPNDIDSIIEAAIFAAGEPLSLTRLTSLFEADDAPSLDAVREAVVRIQAFYEGRGVELKQVATGYRFQARENTSEYLKKLWEKKPPRYTRALLETLALIIYRQPVTRGEIEEVRGVAVSTHIMKQLQEREWVKIVGHKNVPGKPALFATTKEFLDYFNFKHLRELPSLADVVDLDELGEKLSKQLALDIPKQKEHLEEVTAITDDDDDSLDVPDDHIEDQTDIEEKELDTEPL
jgi:segregation and condensation protein B